MKCFIFYMNMQDSVDEIVEGLNLIDIKGLFIWTIKGR